MATVYRAHDTVLGRRVAIKCLSSGLTHSERNRRRFLREARAAAALDHPFICRIIAIEQSADAMLIVMELVEGETLKQRIDRGSLPIEEVLRIADEAAEAMAVAHERGFVHRDLKPANLMLTAQGHVKILDFGIAKRLQVAADRESESLTITNLTTPGQIVGTVSYMAPEQLRREPIQSPSDIFSFGIVLFEMLTGTHPFQRPSTMETASAILSEDPPELASLRADAPPGLAAIVDIALAKDVEQRYASFGELRRALKEVVSDGASSAPVATGIPALATEAAAEPSIAVLPFSSQSSNQEDDYFSDGLAEEIIGALTRIPGLRVVARNSSFAFKGRRTDVRVIGRALSVGAVLDGSVRRSGKRLRITAQLMSTTSCRQIWSHTYDGDLDDVFAFEDRISRDIAKALRVELLPSMGSMVPVRTTNVACYNLYLRGLHHAAKSTAEGYRAALAAFAAALREDESYAMAHIGLAQVYILLGYFTILPPAEAFPHARKHSTRALELDESSAEAWAVLANVSYNYDWDWSDAEKAFARSLNLNPDLVSTLYSFSVFEQNMGRHATAIESAERAAELDPLSLMVRANVGWRYYYADRYDEAIGCWRGITEIDPDFPFALLGLVSAYRDQRRFDEVDPAMEKGLLGAGATGIGVLGHFYALTGRRDEARQLLAELERSSEHGYVGHYNPAFIHLGLGEVDEAIDLLSQAVGAREGIVFNLVAHPFDDVRADPRFRELVRQIGLPLLEQH